MPLSASSTRRQSGSTTPARFELIGALAPRAPDAAEPDADAASEWPPERDAKAALTGMVMGQTVRLAFSGRRTDRYGRLLAHVFIDHDGERAWVQGELLKSGHARAYGLPQNVACLDELIAAEAQARLSGQGLWSSAGYSVRASAESGATQSAARYVPTHRGADRAGVPHKKPRLPQLRSRLAQRLHGWHCPRPLVEGLGGSACPTRRPARSRARMDRTA